MHHGITLFVAVPFQSLKDHTGFTGNSTGFDVQIDELVHPLGVQQNTAAHRNGAALGTAAGTPGGNGDFIVVGDFQNLGHLGGVFGTNHDISLGHTLASVCPHSGQPEIVHAMGDLVDGSGGAIFLSYRILKLGENHGK